MVDEFGREFLLDDEEEEIPVGSEEPSEDDLEDTDDTDDFSTGFGEEEE